VIPTRCLVSSILFLGNIIMPYLLKQTLILFIFIRTAVWDSWDGTILTCDGCVQLWGCAQLCIVPERISGHLATSFTNFRAEEREQRRNERGTKTVYETNFIEIRSTRERLQYKYNFLRSLSSPQIPHSAAANSKPSAAQPSHTCHPQRSLCLPASPSWPE